MIKKITQCTLLAIAILLVGCQTESTILPATVAVELDGKAGTSVTANFIPSSETVSFSYGIGLAEDRPSFENGTINGFGKNTEAVSATFEGLKPDLNYLIFTQGVDSFGNSGPILTTLVSTVGATTSGIIQYITESEVSINFLTADAFYKIGYAISQPNRLEDFKNGYLNETIVMEEVSHWARIGELNPDTEYVIYTKSFPRNTNEKPVYSEIGFTTYAVDACPKVDFEVVDMSVATGFFTFTPNEHVHEYSILFQEKDDRSNILNNASWQNNLQAALASWSGVASIGMIHSSDNKPLELKKIFPDLEQSVEYEVKIICFDVDGNPAQCYEYGDFTTPTYSFHRHFADVDVTHKEFNVSDKSIEITFAPTAKTIAYMYEIVDDVYYQQQTTHTDYHSASISENLYDLGYSNTIRLITPDSPVLVGDPTTGMEPFTFVYRDDKAFKPETQYYIVACPLNVSGHAAGWEKTVIIPFKTPAFPTV